MEKGNKILLPKLVGLIAEKSGKPRKVVEAFLKAYFATIADTLEKHESVKIKDFGTFKVTRIEARKSVNVSTGEDVRIPPHFRVVFTPAKDLAEAVNREFEWLEVIEIDENINPEELNSVDIITMEQPIKDSNPQQDPIQGPEGDSSSAAPSASDSGEKLGRELEEEFGIPEPSEPFGPVDPGEPEPGAPIPNNSGRTEYAEFDPYKVHSEQSALPVPTEHFLLSKDDFDTLATKSEIKSLARSVKRMKGNVEQAELKTARRSANYFIWSLVICVVLIVGGLFLVYFLLDSKIAKDNEKRQAAVRTSVSTADRYEEFSEATLDDVAPIDSTSASGAVPTPAETAKAASQPSGATETTDRVTSSRYLTTMAKEHYGNYNLWPYIYIENEAKLGHPDRIKPGTVVVIPNLEKYGINPANPQDIDKARRLAVEIYTKYGSQ